ncbi:MAG: copper chaperone PCu(A)C [Aquabacterium sp.]|jgi:copper(I)-binding protein|nr:copper chaperone PCu(A)C [Aquabacterium sp.]
MHRFANRLAQQAGASLLVLAVVASAWGGAAYAASPVVTEAAQGSVQVSNAWIRATVKGQQATGGFMDLTSVQSATLLGFETKLSKHAELHEMVMDGDVMRMRAIEALPLPAGVTVSLKPGAHHLMLTDLKRPLVEGESVALTLLIKGEDGKVRKQTVSVAVKAPQMVPTPRTPHQHHAH